MTRSPAQKTSCSSLILLPPQACGRPSFISSLHAISLLSDCLLSRRALPWLWKNRTQRFFFHPWVSRVINKSALAVWLSVGTGAGGLIAVPSGDDFLSQRLACYLSSITLLCDKSQQYCDKWSTPWKVPLWKVVPRKAPQAAGQNGRNMLCPVLWGEASLKGSFQVQFSLRFKMKKYKILEKGRQEN